MSADAEPQVGTHTYILNIVMSCGGCSGAINRKLSKMEDIISYEVSLETQTAKVVTKANLSPETLIHDLSKTGKTILGGTVDGQDINVAEISAASKA